MAAATIASQELKIDVVKRRLCLLAGLKLADPYAVEILEMGTVISIYELIAPENEWERKDIAGNLFLYARSTLPRYGFVVMNIHSMEDFKELITSNWVMNHFQPNMLMYNKHGKKPFTTAIRFPEDHHYIRISSRLEDIVKKEKLHLELKGSIAPT